MSKIPFIIRSMRLRTLPLSLAGVVLGTCAALSDSQWRFSWSVVVLTLLTAALLQILSNLSNELGDYLSGTDTADRQGPKYSLQCGNLSVRDFRVLIAVMAVLCCVVGAGMIYASYCTFMTLQPLALLLLGAAAVWAATQYTLGKNPYGYRGLGDVAVFVFFGLASVLGSYLVQAHTLKWAMILPAVSIGLFSVGVLNVNNIRDMESDRGTRVTVPLKLGARWAKIYQTFLVVGGILSMAGFLCLYALRPLSWMALLAFLPFYAVHLFGVWRRSGRELDGMLPLLVITTFVMALTIGLTL